MDNVTQIHKPPKSFLVERWFGPYVAEVELSDELLYSLIEMTDKIIKDKKSKSMGEMLAGVIDRELKIYKEDLYEAGCNDFLENCVLNYIRGCAANNYELNTYNNINITSNINSCWVVSQYENEYNPIHNHTHCDVSAILYLKVPDYKNRRKIKSKKLKPHDADGDIIFTYSSASQRNYDVLERGIVQIVPKPGLLFLFPSHLQHAVYPFIGEGERRSISFNAVYEIKDKNENTLAGNKPLNPEESFYTRSKERDKND
mgnify:CR=1 FL=1